MSYTDAYQLGVKLAFEKLAVSDTALTAATGFVSPLASGFTAEEGKGLQTSAAGLAGSLLGKKLFRSNLAGRLLGSGGAVAGSKVGAGLVSPDPEEIAEMKRRGEFSKWDYMTRGLRTAGTGALIGGGLAATGGIPAAALGALAGSGRGAFSGFVVSPMIREIMQNVRNQQEDPSMQDSKKLLPQTLRHPATTKTMEKLKKFDKPEYEAALANIMPIARRVAEDQIDDLAMAGQGDNE